MEGVGEVVSEFRTVTVNLRLRTTRETEVIRETTGRDTSRSIRNSESRWEKEKLCKNLMRRGVGQDLPSCTRNYN